MPSTENEGRRGEQRKGAEREKEIGAGADGLGKSKPKAIDGLSSEKKNDELEKSF